MTYAFETGRKQLNKEKLIKKSWACYDVEFTYMYLRKAR